MKLDTVIVDRGDEEMIRVSEHAVMKEGDYLR